MLPVPRLHPSRPRAGRLPFLAAAAALLSVAASADGTLRTLPERIALRGSDDAHGLLVSRTSDDHTEDLTRTARFVSSDEKVLSVDARGNVRPVGDGAAEVWTIAAGLTNRVAVSVAGAATVSAPSFRQDIEPVLTRTGCNMGACHGKLTGQNGFKLSLRGYAPELDFGWLTDDIAARRHGNREVRHAARRGAALLLADPVVLRTMARALEPLAARALRNAATKVRTLLVQRNDAALHAADQLCVFLHAARLGQGF